MRSKVARRNNINFSAGFAGTSPSFSIFAKMKLSTGVFTQAFFCTLGGEGGLIGRNDQKDRCSGLSSSSSLSRSCGRGWMVSTPDQGAPIRTHSVRLAISCSLSPSLVRRTSTTRWETGSRARTSSMSTSPSSDSSPRPMISAPVFVAQVMTSRGLNPAYLTKKLSSFA